MVRTRLYLVLIAGCAFGQTFEVASVKANVLFDRIVNINTGPGGTFSARGYSLKLLIQRAYGIKGWQVSGGPSWLDEDRWDIAARAPRSVGPDWMPEEVNAMLRALLADRFGLKAHLTTKDTRGFVLSTINGSSKLTPSAATEESLHREGNVVVVNGATTASIAVMLGAYLGRPVRDETALPGKYDFRLFWTERADVVAVEGQAEPGLSLPRAVTEQLGLKLTSRVVSAEVLVIDEARKASATEQ